jgi:succinate dehydrogenase (ubiquinone) cytochrome b560 subunit
MFNRLTGIILSGALYLYAIGYLVGPTLGWHFESAVLASGFAAWSVGAKVATKLALASPFVFHSFNGLRHLAWDLGVGFGKQQVIRTGWFVVGLTAVGTLFLTFGY